LYQAKYIGSHTRDEKYLYGRSTTIKKVKPCKSNVMLQLLTTHEWCADMMQHSCVRAAARPEATLADSALMEDHRVTAPAATAAGHCSCSVWLLCRCRCQL